MERKKLLLLVAVSALLVASVVAGYIVWKYTTKITVLEPFEVKTNLPTEISLYPGSYDYLINVTNHGGEDLNATLCYTITTENCDVSVSPSNGTSYKVAAGETVSIPITITVSIDGYSANGTAMINWWIERVSP
jgi:uncharacterized membrane protein